MEPSPTSTRSMPHVCSSSVAPTTASHRTTQTRPTSRASAVICEEYRSRSNSPPLEPERRRFPIWPPASETSAGGGSATLGVTLSSSIAWTYQFLPPDAQTVLRRLAVFRGEFEIDAAAAVVGGANSTRPRSPARSGHCSSRTSSRSTMTSNGSACRRPFGRSPGNASPTPLTDRHDHSPRNVVRRHRRAIR